MAGLGIGKELQVVRAADGTCKLQSKNLQHSPWAAKSHGGHVLEKEAAGRKIASSLHSGFPLRSVTLRDRVKGTPFP